MDGQQLLELIKLIPQIIIYIYPGYLTLWLYSFFNGKSLKEEKSNSIKYIAISSIYIAILDGVNSFFINREIIIFHNATAVFILKNAGLILLLFSLSLAAYFIKKSKGIENFLEWIGVPVTTNDNIIEEFRKDGDTWLEVYMNNSSAVYRGYLTLHRMEDKDDNAIILSRYKLYMQLEDGRLTLIKDHFNYEDRKVVIKFKDISRIHICYPSYELRKEQELHSSPML